MNLENPEYVSMELKECILTRNIFNLYTALIVSREDLKCIEYSGRIANKENGQRILSEVEEVLKTAIPLSYEFEKGTILTANLCQILSFISETYPIITRENVTEQFYKIEQAIDQTLQTIDFLIPQDQKEYFIFDKVEYDIPTRDLFNLIKAIGTLYTKIKCLLDNNQLKNKTNARDIIKDGGTKIKIISGTIIKYLPFLGPLIKNLREHLNNALQRINEYDISVATTDLIKDIEAIRSQISTTYVSNYLVLY